MVSHHAFNLDFSNYYHNVEHFSCACLPPCGLFLFSSSSDKALLEGPGEAKLAPLQIKELKATWIPGPGLLGNQTLLTKK